MTNPPLLALHNLTKLFYKGSDVIRAVDDVSLQIARGDFIAIEGVSGSGKSTLMHLMGGLDWPTSGQVIFDGRDISRLSDRALSSLRRESIGFIFQAYNLIEDLNVLENTALPLKYAGIKKAGREARAHAALERVGMAHRLRHRPSELSGGEEQRVSIARALVNHPEIILADEPTGNLDTSNRDHILQVFTELNTAGQTIVLVTHDPVAAQTANRRLRMTNGKLAA